MERATQYRLTLHNRTNHDTDGWEFCLYQQVPDGCSPGIQSLVWLRHVCHDGCNINFKWEESYAFQWSQTGSLLEGNPFIPSNSLPCDPNNEGVNAVELLKVGDSYQFQPYEKSPSRGKLLIHSGKNIDPSVCVGIGMDGTSIFATPALCNMSHLFSLKPSYYVTFGKFREGCVIDGQIGVDPLQIDFSNSQSMDVTLDENFEWRQTTMEQAAALRAKGVKTFQALQKRVAGLE